MRLASAEWHEKGHVNVEHVSTLGRRKNNLQRPSLALDLEESPCPGVRAALGWAPRIAALRLGFLKAFEGFVVHAHVLERQDGFPRTNQGWQGCPDWSEMSSEQFEIQIVSDRGRCSRPEHIFSQSISLTTSWQVAVGLLTDYTKIKAPKAYPQHL